MNRRVSQVSLREADEFIDKSNPPLSTSADDAVFARFNRAVAHVLAHAARSSRSMIKSK
jgi:hypothetical protein